MSNKLINLLLVIAFLIGITACKSKVTNREKSISVNDLFKIVTEDYYKKNKLEINKYNMFYVRKDSIPNENYYFYSILPIRDDNSDYYYIMDIDYSLSFLPSDYMIYNEKIFFLTDEEVDKPNIDVLNYIDSLNMLDSTRVKVQLGLLDSKDRLIRKFVIDDAMKAVNYIICKDKPYKIRKRIKTSVYIKPDDKRFENICN